MEPGTLKITEIFFSLQGESRYAGMPCAFVRLTGCNLRCSWCDSEYTFKGGTNRSIEDILKTLATYPTKRVEVTGGEPLLQKNVYQLFDALLAAGYEVLVETSGERPISDVPRAVCRVVDYKLPGSGEGHTFNPSNWASLSPHDEVKFVIADRADFDEAARVWNEHRREGLKASFSPVHQVLEPKQLAEWIIASGLDVRLNLQVHKYLWGNVPGH